MATYSAERSVHKTLVAGTVDTITFTRVGTIGERIEVLNRSTADDIYIRLDGTDPVALADNTIIVPPGQAVIVPAGKSVKVISAGAAPYSAQLVA